MTAPLLVSRGRQSLAAAAVLAALIVCGCTVDDGRVLRRAKSAHLVGKPGAPLFVLRPELDPRIEKLESKTGKRLAVAYLTDAYPDVLAVRDFAADAKRLFVLVGRRQRLLDQRMLVLAHDGKLLGRVELAARPVALAWGYGGELLVGHATPARGPTGRLSLVDVSSGDGAARVRASVALPGAVLGIAPLSKTRVALLTREQLDLGGGDPLPRDRVVIVALDTRKVVAQRDVPAGAARIARGPTGLLYVGHASGLGTHETDGTLAAIDPDTLATVERIALSMIVRSMAATPRHLLLNMLSRDGEHWFGVLDRSHRTVFDFEMSSLGGAELVAIGEQAYLPRSASDEIAHIDVRKQRILSPDLVPGKKLPYKDRVTRLVTLMEVRDAP
ncbi:MAG: hypothetical protein KC503_19115 [Myxococcales bacterium]|nr:hypothetical protein [Myxococcales bacterium]